MKPRLHSIPAGPASNDAASAPDIAPHHSTGYRPGSRISSESASRNGAPPLSVLNQLGLSNYDALFDSLGKPLGLIDRDFNIVWANQRYASFVQLPLEKVIGYKLHELHSQNAVNAIMPHLMQGFDGRSSYYDRPARWADGNEQWVRILIRPVFNAEGTITCVLASATNIDDVIEAREEAKASRASLQRILDAVDLPIARWTRAIQLDDCNKPYIKWAKRPREQIIGKTLEELYGTEAWAAAKAAFETAFTGEKTHYSRLLRHHEGAPHWARITVFPEFRADERIDAVYTIAFDIDAEIRAIDKLREAQKRLDVFTENIPNSMTYFDRDFVYRFVSKDFLKRFDLKPEDIIGKKIWEARGKKVWDENRKYIERALAGETVEFELQVDEKETALGWQRVQFTPDFDDEGYVKGVYSTRIDITDLKLAQAALKRDADWDVLTKTYNRNYFNAALSQAIKDADTSPFALYYLDLDGFKQVNDSMGHTVGDELLAHIAQSLKNALRPDDTLARIGGDEFAVLSFRGTTGTPQTLAALADRLLRAANTPFRMGDFSLSLSMSIGVVVVDNTDHVDVRRLLQRADAAMYEAKHNGKNCWVRAH